MSLKQLFFLISTFAVVALVSYVYYFNQAPVTVHYAPGGSFQGSLALTLIVTFSAGLLAASIFAFIFHSIHRLGLWQLRKQMTRNKENQGLLEKGREALAAGDFQRAESLFEKVLKDDPEQTLARSMLAETALQAGDFGKARKVIDESRQSQANNLELLFQGATANAELGNYTAAYDNLSLILKSHPKNIYALERIVEAATKLKRFDEALSRQREFAKLLTGAEKEQALEKLAALQLKAVEEEYGHDRSTLKEQIQNVLREHRDFPAALSQLALLEREEGKLKESVKLWNRAYRESGKPEYLECIAETWLNVDQPSKALGAVKEALAAGPGSHSVTESLFLSKLFLHLEMLDEAERELDAISASVKPSKENHLQHALMRARLLRRKGKDEEGMSQLLRVAEEAGLFEQNSLFHSEKKKGGWLKRAHARKQPSPRLSTP